MPSEALLGLHEKHDRYANFEEFEPELQGLLHQGTLAKECMAIIQALGILEPLTGEHIPPEALVIQGPNWRESVVANGLLSRNRASLQVLQQVYGSLENLAQKDIYLLESLTGFAQWLRRQIGEARMVCTEFLDDTELNQSEVQHQDLCSLTFEDACFDLLLCNELFEHVQNLDQAFQEIARVLRPGGRMVATCPMAFGQSQSIVKARQNPLSGLADLLEEPEFHGDPIRPEVGSLVYRIPAWDLIDQLHQVGFKVVTIHHLASWKYGIIGADLPGILVIEAQR